MGTEPERLILDYAPRRSPAERLRAQFHQALPTLIWAAFIVAVSAVTIFIAYARWHLWLAAMLLLPIAWCVRRIAMRRRVLDAAERRAERVFLVLSIAWPFLIVLATFHRPRGCVHTKIYAAGPFHVVHTVNHGVPLDSFNLGGDWYLVLQ